MYLYKLPKSVHEFNSYLQMRTLTKNTDPKRAVAERNREEKERKKHS